MAYHQWKPLSWYISSLQWRHNVRDSVSNHQPHDCLLNRLFRRRSKKTSKLRITGLWNGNIFRVTGPLWGEFTGHRWIPHTKASDAERLMFSLICVWINSGVNNREAGDLRRHCAHYDVIVMVSTAPRQKYDKYANANNKVFSVYKSQQYCHIFCIFLFTRQEVSW